MLKKIYNKLQMKYLDYRVGQMLNQAKTKWGLGLPFDSSQYVEVTHYIDPELLKTVYKPVRVFSKYHKYYYLVDNDNIAIGFGHIDIEGLKETLTYDLLFFSYFMNYIAASIVGDQQKIDEYRSERMVPHLIREINEANKRAKLDGHFA
jgi:hypothetical protein